MSFAFPWALIGLFGVGYLAFHQVRPGRSGSGRLLFSDLRLLQRRIRTPRTVMAKALPFVRLAALVLLVLGIARPQVPVGVKRVAGAGIDIILTLDISGSMGIDDMGMGNRLEAAKAVIGDFIEQAGPNRLGLVIFARQAFTQSPLTADHKMVKELLDDVHLGMLEDNTAIGMAIATAANRLQSSQAKSKVIILLTDGANNAGEIDPVTAARAADALGIKIYAIGVGKSGLGARLPAPQFQTGAELDEKTLREVVGDTGQFFRATDANALRDIYAQIDKMEKSEYLGAKQIEYRQLYGRFVWPGLLLLVLEFLLSSTWLRKAP